MDSGRSKDFAWFVYMKWRHRNGVVYKWSYSGIAKKYGLSRPTAKKLVNKFIEYGWCKVAGKSLVFNKLKTIDDNKQKIHTELNIKGLGVKEILYALRLAVLQQKQRNFNWLQRLRMNIDNPTCGKAYKRGEKLLKKIGKTVNELPSEKSKLRVSIKRFGEVLGCSTGTAHKFMRAAKENKDVMVWCVEREMVSKRNYGSFSKGILESVPGSYITPLGTFTQKCNSYFFATL